MSAHIPHISHNEGIPTGFEFLCCGLVLLDFDCREVLFYNIKDSGTRDDFIGNSNPNTVYIGLEHCFDLGFGDISYVCSAMLDIGVGDARETALKEAGDNLLRIAERFGVADDCGPEDQGRHNYHHLCLVFRTLLFLVQVPERLLGEPLRFGVKTNLVDIGPVVVVVIAIWFVCCDCDAGRSKHQSF